MGRALTTFRPMVIAAALLIVAAACGGDEEAAPRGPTLPTGKPLDKAGISALAVLFPDNPLTGGQVAPRRYRWVNPNVAMFVQFDDSDLAKATALRYVGVSVKGVFCAEAQPGGPNGGFTHFHRLNAPEYSQGHGGPPGTEGYWLLWMAVDEFKTRDGRTVKPGVDYAFSPTPAPACGSKVPRADFKGPGAKALTAADLSALAAPFSDQPLTGGQVAPRLYKWVNRNTSIFLQFDNPDLAMAKELRYVGLSVRGEFCAQKQPHTDFTHFHRVNAAEYSQGHGGPPRTKGYWLSWASLNEFDTRDGRHVTPGVDRKFSPTPPPQC